MDKDGKFALTPKGRTEVTTMLRVGGKYLAYLKENMEENMKYNIGDVVYSKSTGKFYRVGDINNNGTIKAYGLTDGKLHWTSCNDPMLVPEDEATL